MEVGKKTIKLFTGLDAWKVAHGLVLMIYEITKKFPKEEIFGLTSQISRTVVSITSNIVEQTIKVSKIINGLIKSSRNLIHNS